MSETTEKILDYVGKALSKLSEAEKERWLWFTEGMAAADRAKDCAFVVCSAAMEPQAGQESA